MAALNEPRSASNPASVRRPSRDAGRPLRPETVVSRSFRSPSDWLGILRLVASCWASATWLFADHSASVRAALCQQHGPVRARLSIDRTLHTRDAGRPLLTVGPLSRS